MALDVFLFAEEPLNVRFTADCCDGKVEFPYQFASLMENRVYGLVDSSWFSPLASTIQKSAIVALSEGKAMKSVVKASRCTILATCHSAPTMFTQKASTDESAWPYYQVPTTRNIEIDALGTAWICVFSMTSREPHCE
jgi:hypothetical protein